MSEVCISIRSWDNLNGIHCTIYQNKYARANAWYGPLGTLATAPAAKNWTLPLYKKRTWTIITFKISQSTYIYKYNAINSIKSCIFYTKTGFLLITQKLSLKCLKYVNNTNINMHLRHILVHVWGLYLNQKLRYEYMFHFLE